MKEVKTEELVIFLANYCTHEGCVIHILESAKETCFYNLIHVFSTTFMDEEVFNQRIFIFS